MLSCNDISIVLSYIELCEKTKDCGLILEVENMRHFVLKRDGVVIYQATMLELIKLYLVGYKEALNVKA